ncbi:hemin-degrading factor [Pukyongiella litopenaei]|uniref:Hemin-degrading factor n=1 Tax=Pukyongiella litopenaei TaxID=2605946 RepID=A0A2S0MU48_9RHOB|nr:ChuX/HutX family heme-like substrate-binding protein [Pukyongiella litopenaei]AVO39405.1 hemin-degrading factor [Pukyongiella litopenaei]
MPIKDIPSPADIRAARVADPDLRERDLADRIGITEAQLLAAHIGHGVTPISADPDRVMPAINRLGEVMALTRNDSCVIEKIGVYDDYRGGPHAALIVNGEIDLRLFPRHFAYGFAVEKPLKDGGVRQSLQFFDAAGDAVHKVFLRDSSVVEEWDGLIEELAVCDRAETLSVSDRRPVEPARADPDKADRLRAEWDNITDTHQFLQMVRKLKMNRLGAYRIAGAPYVRPLATTSVATLLERAAATALPIMAFVGNMGCIEIHTGPISTLKPMGPWLNVLDPGFNLHLRADHIAEVWQVTKATRRGDAISVEAFDKDGMLIVQLFGVLADQDAAARWNETVFALDGLAQEETV